MKEKKQAPTLLSDEALEATSLHKTFIERSELAQEIISRTPDFIEKWALFIFLILLLFLITTTWFIQYPDIIEAPAKLSSINAPKQIICLLPGKLVKLQVKENEAVAVGKILGFIESNAKHEEILKLSDWSDSVEQILNDHSYKKLPPCFNNAIFSELGELQQPYQTLIQAYLNFKNYLPNEFYAKKKALLLKDIENIQKVKRNLEVQKTLAQQDLLLSQKTFDANGHLKKEKIISELDYRNEESKLIGKKLSVPQMNAGIISNESQQNDKQKEIAELENTILQQNAIFEQALHTFKSQLTDWKKKYLLIAPIAGKVAFASFIEVNQQLQANQTICFINPENTAYYAQVFIPQTNFGKVLIGENVLLKLNSYPFQEYGYVKGKIDYISHIPSDSGYLSKVVLVDGLMTTYRKQVQYRDGLIARAEIITKDLRLLERFYYNIVQQIKR